MQLAITKTRAMVGMQAPEVTVEVHLSLGLPGFAIVGLPEAAVRESKDRVRSAIINSNFEFPDRKIIVNLAPGDLPKHGSRFDLAIAVGILVASGQLNLPDHLLSTIEFIGELALTGDLRPVKGVLPFAIQTKVNKNILVLPQASVDDVAIIHGLNVFAADCLLDVCAWLSDDQARTLTPIMQIDAKVTNVDYLVDYADVFGQEQGKNALEIAAAGGHNVLMIGSPGSGKTMLASRLMTIMPDLTYEEALEVAAIYSLSDTQQAQIMRRPFRMPHHTASHVALVGGGRPPKPGEISLAHKGVLFLDELPEYSRHSLETLRQPLESGKVHISRAGSQAEFPAEFQLIAAMNPCPCGYYGDTQRNCTCSPDQVRRYQEKISGPLLDRIDIHIEVNSIQQAQWFSKSNNESSADIKARVLEANQRQLSRQGKMNFALSTQEVRHFCQLNQETEKMLAMAGAKYKLSMRAMHRILKVTRTIADLIGADIIEMTHLAQALNLRQVTCRRE
ncbi:MAG: ATP-dependent protease [Legionellales bacterium]|nr:ATP-dependent protease [Legionellales bacterium]